MRILLGLVFLVGCAEGMNVPPDAPDPGGGRREVGADAGGLDTGADAARACNDTIDTLSGFATYIAGSAAATDPMATPIAPGTGTCGDWVAAHQSAFDGAVDLPVVNGTVGSAKTPVALVGSSATAAGCSYTLRWSQDASGGDVRRLCAVTLDYALAVQ